MTTPTLAAELASAAERARDSPREVREATGLSYALAQLMDQLAGEADRPDHDHIDRPGRCTPMTCTLAAAAVVATTMTRVRSSSAPLPPLRRPLAADRGLIPGDLL